MITIAQVLIALSVALGAVTSGSSALSHAGHAGLAIVAPADTVLPHP